MPLYYLLILAIIQGLTEFLPVSSSGHLAMLPHLTGMEDQGQLIDVSVHLGTLGAVVIYFWADVKKALTGLPLLFGSHRNSSNAQLALLLILSTIPVIIFGFVLKMTGLDHEVRSLKVIGWAMLIFGILLYFVDQKSTAEKTQANWNFRDAIVMGLWQAVALIPGSSRSGMTITGARALGYSRINGAKIAMLMSIPTIIASGALLGSEAVVKANWEMLGYGAVAAIFAFGSGLVALKLMMHFLQSISFTPYVIYRIVLGVFLLWIAYT